MNTVHRRDFLRHLFTAAGVTVSPLDRLAFGTSGVAAAQQPRRIVIVGAGLAGLVAAHELVKAGNQVVVLDAQLRAGGRVYTLRDPFTDGLYAEAGAARIPEAHDLTRRYVTEFGLKLISFQPDRPRQTPPNGKRVLEPVEQARGALGNALWSDDSLIEFLDKGGAESPVQHYDKIEGGNDRLPAAFAARLENRIRYGAPVVAIQQDGHGVRAIVQHSVGRDVVSGDFLICAVPFTVLRGMDVSPAFRPAKRRAIEQLTSAAERRIYLQLATRYWTNSGNSGFELTEDVDFFDATFGQPGDRGIMMLYALGDSAVRIEHLMPDQRIRYGRDEAERIYPGMSTNFERGFSWCWGEAPWARGAFALYKPDQWSTLQPVAIQPEGRIHFAGEHLSSWPGWMQGALASGLRVAREVSARA